MKILVLLLIGVDIVHVEHFSYMAGYWVLGLEINWKLSFQNVATFRSISNKYIILIMRRLSLKIA